MQATTNTNRLNTLYLTISTGFAMFSMFFGAGNLVFPLVVGKTSGDFYFISSFGLLITGVFVPFLGLFGIILFQGDSKQFFARMGKIPGITIGFLILSLLGPFAVIPRCINVAYGSFTLIFPEVSLILFSVIACLVIYILLLDKAKLISIMGMVLTPIMLILLAVIIGKAVMSQNSVELSNHTALTALANGLREANKSMDLLAAFFFGVTIFRHIQQNCATQSVYKLTINSSLIGMVLLAAIYLGFVYIGSKYAGILAGVPAEKYLGTIAHHTLGSYAGPIVCVAVILACLTTAVALTSIYTDYLAQTITASKINYQICIVVTLIIAFLISTLEFSGIMAFIAPILEATYPGLILLTVLNIIHKKYAIEVSTWPVYATFAVFTGYILFS